RCLVGTRLWLLWSGHGDRHCNTSPCVPDSPLFSTSPVPSMCWKKLKKTSNSPCIVLEHMVPLSKSPDTLRGPNRVEPQAVRAEPADVPPPAPLGRGPGDRRSGRPRGRPVEDPAQLTQPTGGATMNDHGITCLHCEAGLCPACQADYEEDPDGYVAMG